jgi:hypothetical protein
VTTGKIDDGTILTEDLADDAVTTEKIDNGTILAADLATDSVTSLAIDDGTISLADLDDDSVDANSIVDGSIGIADINPGIWGAVVNQAGVLALRPPPALSNEGFWYTATDVGGGTTYRSNGVAWVQIAGSGDGNVGDNTITTVKLQDNAITSAKVQDGTLVNADINAGANIALSKLATDPLARANHTGTQLASTISNFDTQVHTSRLDQMAAPNASISMAGHTITNVTDPSAPQDAATKAYVDAASITDPHASVRAGTTANLAAISGLLTIDGIVLAPGDRVLVKNQNTPTENGIYLVAPGAWTRSNDADAGSELTGGSTVFVEQGTINGDTQWYATTIRRPLALTRSPSPRLPAR